MPEEFENMESKILCNDCLRKTTTKYHFSYHKCSEWAGIQPLSDTYKL